MNKKMAREIVESLPSLYPLMTADEEEAIWTVLATNSNTENDGDYISRQQAIDTVCLACGHDCDKSKFVYNAPQDEQVIMCPEHYAISTMPPVTPKQAEGEWIPHKSKFGGDDEPVYTCNKCGDNIGFRKRNFCPECGAKMVW